MVPFGTFGQGKLAHHERIKNIILNAISYNHLLLNEMAPNEHVLTTLTTKINNRDT